ncbi:hypothetical protein SCHPADRAFT_942039 [Schizopora paradoxa]|uniref:Uncharacterized protein n=1 Tax=Schizopora paradoxa TaxID=27342 RepID=A0A0H2RHT2_9AGAM|nr:hypothetical protein SCHPADRAFT_942039 [Schizopora paradoxa]
MTELIVDETSLENVIDALNVLKNEGCSMDNGQLLWCEDWMLKLAKEDRSKDTGECASIVKLVKATLSNMKCMSKTLETLSSSLKGALQRVAHQTTNLIRVVGFDSLPDDVLARIFEFHHLHALYDIYGPYMTLTHRATRSSHVLARVSRRFRRIALHIPALWQEVSDLHKAEWIDLLNSRTQHPSVHVENFDDGFEDIDEDEEIDEFEHRRKKRDVVEFLQLLHPTEQWRELVVKYAAKEDGRAVFNYITSEGDGDLQELRSLRLTRDCFFMRGDDDDDGVRKGQMLSDIDHDLFAQWSVDNLTTLTLRDVIPTRLSCSQLKECDISLTRTCRATFRWDLSALRDLLENSCNLESLDLYALNARALPDLDIPEQVKLLKLKAFTFKIVCCTEPQFVQAVMDIFDAPMLESMDINLSHRPVNPVDNGIPQAWLDAIFRPAPLVLRTFPNLLSFNLSLEFSSIALPFESVLRSIPRVCTLTLDIPQCYDPPFSQCARNYGCLRDLRVLRLRNWSGMSSPDLIGFVTHLRNAKGSEALEALELEGCNGFVERREALEKLLGNKLVWKG